MEAVTLGEDSYTRQIKVPSTPVILLDNVIWQCYLCSLSYWGYFVIPAGCCGFLLWWWSATYLLCTVTDHSLYCADQNQDKQPRKTRLTRLPAALWPQPFSSVPAVCVLDRTKTSAIPDPSAVSPHICRLWTNATRGLSDHPFQPASPVIPNTILFSYT